MAFPSLSVAPDTFSLVPVDNAIISPPEAGIVMARRRFTRQIYTITVSYPALTEADFLALKAHYDTVSGASSFSFTHETITYTVRYKKLQLDQVQSNYSSSIIFEIV